MSQIKLSAVALAAMGLFAGAAQAQSTMIASSGASATRGTVISLFQSAICQGAVAQFWNAPSAEGGSNVRAVRCGGVGTKVFSIDTDGGSWRAAAVKNAAAFNASVTDPALRKVRYLDISSCPTPTVGAGTSASPWTCTPTIGTVAAKIIGTPAAVPAVLTAPTDVDIGFSDIDQAAYDGVSGTDLGTGLNVPVTNWTKFSGSTGAGGTVTPIPALGVVFGVAASRQLILDLMADQGITAATNPTCFPGGVADLSPAQGEVCAPVISKDQYRSLTTSTLGQLNTSWDNLFRNAGSTPGPVLIERRDVGSGTQAVANAYFHGVGCTPYFLTPGSSADDPAFTENNATADVIARLSLAGVRAIGVVSRENAPSAAGGWGFLKLGTSAERGAVGGLNAAYPDSAAAARGHYDFWSVGYAFKKSNETNADVNAVVNGLIAQTNIAVTDGVFRLPAITASTRGTGTGNPPNTGTWYSKTGMTGNCVGALAN